MTKNCTTAESSIEHKSNSERVYAIFGCSQTSEGKYANPINLNDYINQYERIYVVLGRTKSKFVTAISIIQDN